MRLKLIPKNEQELSKLFVLIFPLTLLLASLTSFLKDAYFTFANLIPNNKILSALRPDWVVGYVESYLALNKDEFHRV